MKTLVISMHPTPASSVMGKKVKELLKREYDADIHEISDVISMSHAQLTPEEIKAEQSVLVKYDRLIFLSPMYWFSATALGMLWLEEVFTDGFVYGTSNEAAELARKEAVVIFTSGAVTGDFTPNKCGTIEAVAHSLKEGALFCSMDYKGGFNFASDANFEEVMKDILAKVPK